METIIVEKLGVVSLRSGIVYVQCFSGGADGKDRVSGELAIPLSQFNLIVNSFQSTGKNLNERIQENINEKKASKEKDGGGSDSEELPGSQEIN